MDYEINKVENQLKQGLYEIAKKSKDYVNYYLGIKLKEKSLSKDGITQNWWHAFEFACGKIFYQGRRDNVSGAIKKQILHDLESLLGTDYEEKTTKLDDLKHRGMFELQLFKRQPKETLKQLHQRLLDDNHIILKHLVKNKKGRDRDRLMIINFLTLITEIHDKNIIRYLKEKIENGKIKDAYHTLRKVISIGDKIACLLLRDIVLLYDLEDYISDDDKVFIMPMDTWLRKISYAFLTKYLKEKGISFAQFNAGAWCISTNKKESS